MRYKYHADINRGKIALRAWCSECRRWIDVEDDETAVCKIHGEAHAGKPCISDRAVCRACQRAVPTSYNLHGWEVCEECYLEHLNACRPHLTRNGQRVTDRITVEQLRQSACGGGA